MSIKFTNLNLFQAQSIEKLSSVGIEAEPVANWITCVDHKGNRHTIMSEQGINELISKAKES